MIPPRHRIRPPGPLRMGPPLLQDDGFVPPRDVRFVAERAHLGLERLLRLGLAVDQEDPPGKAGITRSPALAEGAKPVEELWLVGVGREAADRADPAANVHLPAIDPDPSGAGL